MTTIENEHSNCMKMVSCKVTFDNQNGCRWCLGPLWAPRVLGPLGEHQAVSGVYWGLAGTVDTQGPEGI